MDHWTSKTHKARISPAQPAFPPFQTTTLIRLYVEGTQLVHRTTPKLCAAPPNKSFIPLGGCALRSRRRPQDPFHLAVPKFGPRRRPSIYDKRRDKCNS
jgi:hypothetical protein